MKTQSISTNVFFNVIKAFMGIIFPLISFPYAARVLGAESLGMVQYCNSVISYFNLFAGLGISIYATREGVRYRDSKGKLSKFVKEVLFINLVTTCLSYFILIIVVANSDLKDYGMLLAVCSLNIVFTTFSIDWLYQILENYSYISIRAIIFQVISLIMLLLLVKNREDYILYAFINVFAAGGSFALNIWNSRKYVDWFGKAELSIGQHLKPILTIFGISASTSIYLNLDTLMIGIYRGNLEVGLYSASVKLITVIKTLLSAISSALLPRLSYYKEKAKDEQYISLLKKCMNMILLLVIPASFGIIMLRKEILYFFGGIEYITATFASAVLALNMVFSVIDGMLYNQFFLPMKMEEKTCMATICGAICNFVLNLFIIPQYGYNGAAITTLFSEMVVFGVLLVFMKGKIKISDIFGYCYQYVIASLSIIVIVFGVHKLATNDFICIILSVILSMMTYTIMLVLLKNPVAKEIRNSFISVFKNKFKRT